MAKVALLYLEKSPVKDPGTFNLAGGQSDN